MGGLTEEQKRRIEENRQRALQRRAQKDKAPCTLNQPVQKPTWQGSVTKPKQSSLHKPTFTGVSSTKASTSSSSTSTSSSDSRTAKTFTSIHPPTTAGGRVFQTSPIKRFGGPVSTNQSSANNVSTNMNTNPGFHSKPGATKTFQSYSGNSSNTSSASASNPSAKSSTLNFYSSKTSSSNSSKPSFTSSSSSYRSKGSYFSNESNQSQTSWQKRQPSGAVGAGTSNKARAFGDGTSNNASLYGGGLTGKCVLVTRKRFEVDVAFNAKLIDIFKQLSTKSYDAVTKRWSFDLSEYDTLVDAVRCLRPAVEIEPLPKSVCIAFRSQRHGHDKPRQIPNANLNSVDRKLVDALMPFQREGINFAVANEGRILIADEMGLGKTIQAICVAYYYRTEWPLLIVTPSSLRYSWAEALEKWLPSLDPDSINVVLTGKADVTAGLVNILSYDLMARKVDVLTKAGFQVIILDESHFMKNIKTARSKAALAIVKQAPRVLLLSGTPALSRPAELFTQVKAVKPNLFPSHFHEFGVRYCDGKQNQWGMDYSGSSNLSELQLLLDETIMIRRLKADVLSQLPSKTRQMVLMDPQSVKTNSKSLKHAAKEMGQKKKAEQRGALMQYFNETGIAKIPAIKDYVIDLLESGCKMLVFGHHQKVLDAICECVTNKKYEYIRIDGSTSAPQRQKQVDCFQQKESCRVAVLSITAANAGLTLTAASLVIFAELFWNPGIMIQAEDRVHRIGQKDCVNIRYLIAKGTADDYIWPLVQKKLTVLEKAGLSRDDFSEAESTTFEDPRQRKIYSFFEQSFFEGDEENALAELAMLEAAEADGTASQAPEEDPKPTKSSINITKPSHSSSDTLEKQCKTKENPVSYGKETNQSKVSVGEHTEIKRLAKSTHRKFDRWRKTEEEHNVEEQVIDELVNDDFDLDSAVLEDDSDQDSPSIFESGKRQKTLFSGSHNQGGFIPPFKKQRHL